MFRKPDFSVWFTNEASFVQAVFKTVTVRSSPCTAISSPEIGLPAAIEVHNLLFSLSVAN